MSATYTYSRALSVQCSCAKTECKCAYVGKRESSHKETKLASNRKAKSEIYLEVVMAPEFLL